MTATTCGTKKRILVVDDDLDLTTVVRMILESTGQYEVRVVSHPMLAAKAVLQFQPHLVLLDVLMPELDGGGVAAEIRAHPETQHVPILFLTAAVTAEEARRGSIGGERYLEKPVNRERLLAAVAQRAV